MPLDFLKSPRFWQLFIVGLAAAISDYNSKHDIASALMVGAAIWFGGSVAVGTYDRGVDKKAASNVQAAQITNNTPIAEVLPPVSPEPSAPSMAPNVPPTTVDALKGQIEAILKKLEEMPK